MVVEVLSDVLSLLDVLALQVALEEIIRETDMDSEDEPLKN